MGDGDAGIRSGYAALGAARIEAAGQAEAWPATEELGPGNGRYKDRTFKGCSGWWTPAILVEPWHA